MSQNPGNVGNYPKTGSLSTRIGFDPSPNDARPLRARQVEAARACCGTTWAPPPGRTWPPSRGEPSPATRATRAMGATGEILLEHDGKIWKHMGISWKTTNIHRKRLRPYFGKWFLSKRKQWILGELIWLKRLARNGVSKGINWKRTSYGNMESIIAE
jgi:hypothetical protein